MNINVAFPMVFVAASLVIALQTDGGRAQQINVPEWHLVETLRIGENAGRPEYQFTRPNRIAIARDSSVFVLEVAGNQIRHFDSRGRFVRAFGRSGRGPGEFTMVASMGLVGDTGYVSDMSALRTTLFARSGELIATLSFREQVSLSTKLFSPFLSVLLPDGSGLGRAWTSGEAVAAGRAKQIPYLRITRNGTILDTVAWVAARPELRQDVPRVPADLEDFPLSTIAPDGSRIVIVDRSAATSGTGSSFTVTVVRPTGDTLLRRQYSYAPHPVAGSRRRTILAGARTQDSLRAGVISNAAVEQFARALPAYYPPISDVIVGYDGTLWLRRESDDTLWTWDVLNAAGNRIAFVRMKKTSELMAVDRQMIWVVERDALDIPTLVRYAPRQVGLQ